MSTNVFYHSFGNMQQRIELLIYLGIIFMNGHLVYIHLKFLITPLIKF